MSNEHAARPQLEILLSRLVDGRFTEEDSGALHRLLAEHPEQAGTVVDHLLLDSLLTEALGRESLTALIDVDQPRLVPPADRPPPRTRRALPKVAGWAFASAALLALAFFLGWRQSRASAEELLQAALEAHGDPVERVYVVTETRRGLDERRFTLPPNVRVTTQGDRFWAEMDRAEKRWAWGREPDGVIWLTLGATRAMKIEPTEAGVGLQYLGDIYSLRVESLLRSVLKHCRIEQGASDTSTHRVTATPKSRIGSGWMRSMTLELDRETRAIRRLVLDTRTVTTTFTLVEARSPDESLYRAEGHLKEPFEILTRRSLPDRRREILVDRFGPEAAGWIRGP